MTRRKEASLSEVVNRLLEVSAPTLKQYAERSGIGYSTLLDWQRNPRSPRGPNLARLERAALEQRDEIDRLISELRRATK